MSNDGYEYFDTLADVEARIASSDYWSQWSVAELIASGDVYYEPPIDPPLIGDSKDYRLLNDLAGYSISLPIGEGLPQDRVTLPDGISFQDLSLGWGTTVGEDGQLRATLDLGWGGATHLRLAMPNAGDLIGWGIE